MITAVENWGIGRPDFYGDVIASIPTIQETQTAWKLQKAYTIALQSVETDTIYTVPEGHTLVFGGGSISVKDSCINKLQIFAPDSIIGDFMFDMAGNITQPLTNQTVTAGTDIIVYIYNNDTITSDFSLILSGVLNEVE